MDDTTAATSYQITTTPQLTRRITIAARTILISPAVVLVATAVRLLIIADYNVPTAITIVTAGGITSALLGTTVTLTATFMPLLTVILVVFRRWKLAPLSLVGAAFVSPAYAGVPQGFVLALSRTREMYRLVWEHHWYVQFWRDYWECIIAVAVAFLARLADQAIRHWGDYSANMPYYAARRISAKGYHLDLAVDSLISALLIAIVIAFPSFMVISTFFKIPAGESSYSRALAEVWLPPERVTLNNGSMIVGYVLSTGNGWFAVLVNSSRAIVYIPATSVSARVVCQLPQYKQARERPVIDLATSFPGRVPGCPS